MRRGALRFPFFRDPHHPARKKAAPGLNAMATHRRMDPFSFISHREGYARGIPSLVSSRSFAQTHWP